MEMAAGGEIARPNLLGIPHWAIAAALFAVFLVSGALSLRNDAPVFDETAHLPAGLSYLDRWDFRLNPEHPPLPKLWAALPVWLSGQARPDYESPAWRGRSIAPGTTMRTSADQWVFGFETINGARDRPQRRDPAAVLVPARLAMLLWGALLGWVVFAWAREMWGAEGGLLALFLYCLSPTMLAHSRLVTTDLPVALGFTLTLWCFWRYLRQPDLPRGVLVGLAFAFALLVKYSALLLAPILVLLAVVWTRGPRLERWERYARGRAVTWVLLGALAIGWVGVWAGYGFRYLATPDEQYQLDWGVIDLDHQGLPWRAIEALLGWRLLPQGYVYGLAYFLGGAARRLAYLNGEQSLVGWWYYFPESFLLKTPPVLLLLLLAVLAVGAWRSRGRSFDAWYLAIPVLVYVAVSMASRLNIGHRHLAAIYPLLFVGCGGLMWMLRPSRWRAGLLAVAAVGYLGSFAAATPGYLSYFDFLAGGSAGGWRYLLDSNIDWGQDLARLPAAMERAGIERVHLAYFGTADPRAYDFDWVKTVLVSDFYPNRPESRPASGDYLAVSLNIREGLYLNDSRQFAIAAVRRGHVPYSAIEEWSDLRERRSRRGERTPSLPEWLIARGLLTPAQRREIESGLLSSWLARLRDTQRPVAVAGDSIYIYRVP